MTNEQIAKVTHETNRAYCQAIGDNSQVSWEDAPEWQRISALKGVECALNGATPEQLHESWLKEKEQTGWKYGAVKNPETKEHPCFVAYSDLPEAQKKKDALFSGVVNALK